MDKVAVVILNWNGKRMLERYLNSVVAYSKQEAVVYVADNASTDDSLQFLNTHHPEVKVIPLEKNWGFAEGYNMALKKVSAQYFVLLNSDVEVTHHWLTPLIEFMDSHPDVAACQPKLLADANHDQLEYAGAAGGFIDWLGYPFCRGRVFDTVEEDNGQYDYPMEVMWATGACLFIRADDYFGVGGLDARFFAHNEEIDLCWRLNIMGRKVWCIPESTVFHLGGGTLPQGNPRKTFLNFRNNLTMLYKNLPEEELKKVMRWRWWLDYLAAFQTLILNGNWGDFKAIFKARRAFKKWRHLFKDDRERIQAARNTADSPKLRAPFSIVWQYHARGKKTFSQLFS
ncbi:MAG: glycosyltransferase family 2 protein [Prevotella sp.]|nr:glycosyltransferase family 2 protein [Prevotella sp.]